MAALEPGGLPRVLVLTDRSRLVEPVGDLVALVRSLAGCTDTAVVFREKDLPPDDRTRLGELVAEAASDARLPLLVASDVALARRVAAAGVHLAATDPWPIAAGPRPVGRSCHDADEVTRAAAEGAAWVTVSPVHPTVSKPGYGPPLGLDGLRRLTSASPVPVYALGGIGPGRAADCIRAGAHGVAVLGAVMAASDPAGVVAMLVDEVASALAEAAG